MYFYKEDLINMIVPDKPDPNAAKVLQETLGGQFGEMRTMMQYSFQSANFRGKAKQYRDLIRGVFLEELSHVELVQSTINQLLNDAGGDMPGNAGIDGAPLDDVIRGGANPIISSSVRKLPSPSMLAAIHGMVHGFMITVILWRTF